MSARLTNTEAVCNLFSKMRTVLARLAFRYNVSLSAMAARPDKPIVRRTAKRNHTPARKTSVGRLFRMTHADALPPDVPFRLRIGARSFAADRHSR
jgi:hypothetical protein